MEEIKVLQDIQLLNSEMNGRIENYMAQIERQNMTRDEANHRFACLATLCARLSGAKISSEMTKKDEEIEFELEKWASEAQSHATFSNKNQIKVLRNNILQLKRHITCQSTKASTPKIGAKSPTLLDSLGLNQDAKVAERTTMKHTQKLGAV